MDAAKINNGTDGGIFIPVDILAEREVKSSRVNTSGITPLDTRVLVLPDQVEEKTAGGIILPDQRKEREGWAQTRATFIAAGENAFLDWGDEAAKPKPGMKVIIAQYAGSTATHDGTDGQKYRICKDEDVLAFWEA